ncbi:reverse transcriptase domain-containing protein [Alkalicoccus luteus]|uniref:reverse transcriptase domain-containing protein n=1 Tax=Alkalicoccus luteus TaxID=1237094 RepID=UPI0040349E8F
MQAYKLFRILFSLNQIKNFYKTSNRIKPSTGIDGVNETSFSRDIDLYSEIINRKVVNGTYGFTPYKEKLISKGRDKYPRVISVPTLRDKLTLALLHQLLSKVFDDNLNKEIVHTVISNLKKELNKDSFDYFIKIDIEKFYDNIPHDKLISKLKNKIRKKEILHLIKQAIITPTIANGNNKQKPYSKNERGVPQGLSISNTLANVYMSDLDNKYQSDSSLKYFRYVDDILILCDSSKGIETEINIINDLNNKGLSVNQEKNKCGHLVNDFTFLGYQFRTRKAEVQEHNIHKIEASIIEVFTKYKYSQFKRRSEFIWTLNLKITGGIIDEKKYGWVFFYSQIDRLEVLYHLDKFLQKMMKRFDINNIQESSIKSFARTFHEVYFNKANTKYIPNFDLFSEDQKRIFLNEVVKFKNVKYLSADEVNEKFKRHVFHAVKKLDKDIQHFS